MRRFRSGDGSARGRGRSAAAAVAAVVLAWSAGAFAAGPLPGRPRLPLGGEWQRCLVARPTDQPGGTWGTFVLPKADAFPRGDAMQGVWYQRQVDIPADWQGKRIVLHIGHCMYGAVVYCNGARAGEIPGYGGDVDLTTVAQPGRPNAIRLFSGRLGQGLARLDAVSRCIAEYYAQREMTTGIGIICPEDEFYCEARSPEVFVEDVWYQTYTRGMQRIEPFLTIRAAAATDGVRAKVVVYDPATGAAVKDRDFDLPPLAAGSNGRLLVIPAVDLKRWALREPNLYLGQVTLTDARGRTLDRTHPVSFGVREFWAQGRDWYMNNAPVHFVCGSAPVEGTIDGFMKVGVTLFTHGVPYWGRFLSEDMTAMAALADRKGAGFVPTGVSMSQVNLNDPEVLRDYDVWARAHARRLQNHPSVLIYGLGYNTPGGSPDFIPTKVGVSWNTDWDNALTTLAYQFSVRADPTRVYYYYGGARAPATWSANWYPNHTPIQEIEEWFGHWHRHGDKPIVSFESTTGTMGPTDYERNGVGYATEYAAILAGDAAYGRERDDYLSYITHLRNRNTFWSFDLRGIAPQIDEQKDAARVRTTRAWRFWGFPFWNWDYMDEVYAPGRTVTGPQDRDGLRLPSLAWIGGPPDEWPSKDHNFYSGDTVAKSVMVIRDLNGQAVWKAAWEARLAGAGAPFARGVVEQAVGAYARLRLPFSFTAPRVSAPTAATIALTVRDASGAEVGRDAFALTIHPRRPAPAGGPVFSIIDPAGETAAWLAGRGVSLRAFDPKATSKPGVLILGRKALRGMKELPFTAAQVAAGLRVVVFEQLCEDLGNIGFRHEDCRPRQVFIRQPLSPLARGLDAEGLRDWRGAGTLVPWGPDRDRLPLSSRTGHSSARGTVASAVIETPHFGPFLPVLDCEFDLGYTPLVSWRHGAGEVVFCQLDVTGRIGREPGADTAADNLIRYLGQPASIAQARTAVCLDKGTAGAIEARGFKAGVLGGKLDPAADVVVVTGAQARAFAARRKRIVDFARAGGQVLVLYASEELAADPAFGGMLKLARTRVTRAGTAVDAHPLLAGVGPQNIHWREPIELMRLSSSDPRFTPLLGGFMGVRAEGKGRFVFLQTDPAAMADLTLVKAEDAKIVEDLKAKKSPLADKKLPDSRFVLNRKRSRWQLDKLHSLILANLGVESSAALTKRLFTMTREIPFTPVNAWVVLGPIPPYDMQNSDRAGDPLDRPDLAELAGRRDMAWRMKTARGATIGWNVPTDSQNGLGLDGKVDLAKIWGIRVRDLGIAVTHLWSTREREATLGLGADWWLKVLVNGQPVYEATKDGFAINFDRKVTVRLKAGWNEVLCYLGAGSNGHYFNFQITNPGDLVVAQQLTPPAAAPEGLPPVSALLPDTTDRGFSLYTEPLVANDDPYAYYAW